MPAFADVLLTACSEAPTFAVLDGAQFDNLPDALREGEFVARSLYLNRGDNNPDQVITAPHLVLLDERPANVLGRAPAQTIPALLDLLDGKPAAVFWQCPIGEEALFKHLRGINMIRLPRTESAPENDPYETVIFRHADANAMRQVLAVVLPQTLDRLLGSANSIILASDEGPSGAPWIIPRNPHGGGPVPGMLVLSAEEYGRMNAAKLNASRTNVAAYLRAQCPGDCANMSDADLHRIVMDSEYTGKELGLRSEAAHAQWAFLNVVTGGEIAGGAPVREALVRSHNPDFALREIMLHMSRLEADDLMTGAGSW